MRNSKKGKALPVDGIVKGGSTFTKEEVVFSEVGRAIRLFFFENDLISCHLLAGAAREVIQVLLRKAGKESFNDNSLQHLKSEYHHAWREERNAEYNWMKHGSKDIESVFEGYTVKVTELLLFEVCWDFTVLFSGRYLEPTIYLSWFFARYPHIAELLTTNPTEANKLFLGEYNHSNLAISTKGARFSIELLDDSANGGFKSLVREGVTVEKVISRYTEPKNAPESIDGIVAQMMIEDEKGRDS
ncbi:hypothetical protein [Sphingobium yanoikuyae]|uniref:hypothetical protein n=1 Tax=Sphingobium yanoikuyae TaxID=13690 RepID=UPI0028AA62B2|nr:hypothetical protein [Sphingobium yanoikuyae]